MYNLYAIRDCKSGTFDVPFVAVNHATAKRDFVLRLSTDSAVTMVNPSDFDLFYVGTWDPSYGVLTGTSHEWVTCGSYVADDVGRVAGYIKEVMPPK